MREPIVDIVPATDDHAIALSLCMRGDDRAEVAASHGHQPLEALRASLGMSPGALALLIDGKVACIWGVAPINILTGFGAIWLLTGTLVDRYPKLFLKTCKQELPKLTSRWPQLLNFIDARYGKALRWARWAGFEVKPVPEPFGVAGHLFHQCRIGERST